MAGWLCGNGLEAYILRSCWQVGIPGQTGFRRRSKIPCCRAAAAPYPELSSSIFILLPGISSTLGMARLIVRNACQHFCRKHPVLSLSIQIEDDDCLVPENNGYHIVENGNYQWISGRKRISSYNDRKPDSQVFLKRSILIWVWCSTRNVRIKFQSYYMRFVQEDYCIIFCSMSFRMCETNINEWDSDFLFCPEKIRN